MILFILALGFVLRLISINQSFWLDEATSATVATGLSVTQIINSFSPGDFHPPVYYILLNLWAGLFGSSELALRLPSILFGLGSIFFAYKIALKVFDKSTAVLTALFLTINPLHIYYSQEARMYSLAMFLVVLTVYCFIHKRFWLTGVLFALAVFSDYLTVFMLPIFLMNKHSFKNLAKVFLPLLVFGLAWIGIFSQQFSRGLSVKTNTSAWWDILGRTSPKQIALISVKFIIGRISFVDKYIYSAVIGWTLVISGLGLVKANR